MSVLDVESNIDDVFIYEDIKNKIKKLYDDADKKRSELINSLPKGVKEKIKTGRLNGMQPEYKELAINLAHMNLCMSNQKFMMFDKYELSAF